VGHVIRNSLDTHFCFLLCQAGVRPQFMLCFLAPCFSETKNRQKAAIRVSQKHTPLPNLCHTDPVTATNMRPAGWRQRSADGANPRPRFGAKPGFGAKPRFGPQRLERPARLEYLPGDLAARCDPNLALALRQPGTEKNRKEQKGTQRNDSPFPLLWSRGPIVPWSRGPIVPWSDGLFQVVPLFTNPQ
jgi:hypothetical protein